jgi:hypothetical protein
MRFSTNPTQRGGKEVKKLISIGRGFDSELVSFNLLGDLLEVTFYSSDQDSFSLQITKDEARKIRTELTKFIQDDY